MKLKDIAVLLGGRIASGEPELEITGAAGLEDAEEGHITFLSDGRHLKDALRSRASAIMVVDRTPELKAAQLVVPDPQFAFVKLLEHFYLRPYEPSGISRLAFVSDSASVSEGATVHAFAYISSGASVGKRSVIHPGVFLGDGAAIGEDCVIYPNVVVREGVKVGDRVIVHAGAVLGSDGFGYVRREGRHYKIPQVGGVVIGDDVEIGANAAIDRATTGRTLIGRGTKIDNLVQIAHNVSIGEHSIIVSQVGIAGSSRIGNSVVLAGQVGVTDHAAVGDGSMIGAQSGVVGAIPGGGAYSGSPAIPHREWLRAVSLFAKLPEMMRRIRSLEDRLKGPDASLKPDEAQKRRKGDD